MSDSDSGIEFISSSKPEDSKKGSKKENSEKSEKDSSKTTTAKSKKSGSGQTAEVPLVQTKITPMKTSKKKSEKDSSTEDSPPSSKTKKATDRKESDTPKKKKKVESTEKGSKSESSKKANKSGEKRKREEEASESEAEKKKSGSKKKTESADNEKASSAKKTKKSEKSSSETPVKDTPTKKKKKASEETTTPEKAKKKKKADSDSDSDSEETKKSKAPTSKKSSENGSEKKKKKESPKKEVEAKPKKKGKQDVSMELDEESSDAQSDKESAADSSQSSESEKEGSDGGAEDATSEGTDSESDSESEQESKSKAKKKPKAEAKKMKKVATKGKKAKGEKKDAKDKKKGSGRRDIRQMLTEKELNEETLRLRALEEERLKKVEEQNSQNAEAGTEEIVVSRRADGTSIVVPKAIAEYLKPHQVDGVRFMWQTVVEPQRDELKGGILAHSMGLGKTLQVITFIDILFREHESLMKDGDDQRPMTALIVAPLSVLGNWRNEFKQYRKKTKQKINVFVLDDKVTATQRMTVIYNWHTEGGVLVTNPEKVQAVLGAIDRRAKAIAKKLTEEKEKITKQSATAATTSTSATGPSPVAPNPAAGAKSTEKEQKPKQQQQLPMEIFDVDEDLTDDPPPPPPPLAPKPTEKSSPQKNSSNEEKEGSPKDKDKDFLHSGTRGSPVEIDEVEISVDLELADSHSNTSIDLNSDCGTPMKTEVQKFVQGLEDKEKSKEKEESSESEEGSEEESEEEEEEIHFSKWTSEKQDAVIMEALRDPGPFLMVVDEGHDLKNPKAKRTQCLTSIRTRRRLILTGTPLQNNPMEFFYLVDFVRPMFLGTAAEFANMYGNPIINGQASDSTPDDVRVARACLFDLNQKLRGIVHRRNVSILSSVLPPKHEFVLTIKLSPIQEKLYKEFVARCNPMYTNFLAMCHSTQKICNHPDLLADLLKRKLESGDGAAAADKVPGKRGRKPKSEKEKEKAKEGEKGEQSEQSPTSVAPLQTADEDAKLISSEALNWALKFLKEQPEYEAGKLELSTKLEMLMSIVDLCWKANTKLLIFSQYVECLDMISGFLSKRDVPTDGDDSMAVDDSKKSSAKDKKKEKEKYAAGEHFLQLDGSMSSGARETSISDFNDAENPAKIFLISTRAGGLGINLTSATRVVLFDSGFNPSQELQALFRTYRYGQKNEVFVYRLIGAGTVEEAVYAIQVRKTGLSLRVVDEQGVGRSVASNIDLFKYDPASKGLGKRPPDVSKDSVLTALQSEYKERIVEVHSHDSLFVEEDQEKLSMQDQDQCRSDFAVFKQRKVGLMAPSDSKQRAVPHQGPTLRIQPPGPRPPPMQPGGPSQHNGPPGMESFYGFHFSGQHGSSGPISLPRVSAPTGGPSIAQMAGFNPQQHPHHHPNFFPGGPQGGHPQAIQPPPSGPQFAAGQPPSQSPLRFIPFMPPPPHGQNMGGPSQPPVPAPSQVEQSVIPPPPPPQPSNQTPISPPAPPPAQPPPTAASKSNSEAMPESHKLFKFIKAPFQDVLQSALQHQATDALLSLLEPNESQELFGLLEKRFSELKNKQSQSSLESTTPQLLPPIQSLTGLGMPLPRIPVQTPHSVPPAQPHHHQQGPPPPAHHFSNVPPQGMRGFAFPAIPAHIQGLQASMQPPPAGRQVPNPAPVSHSPQVHQPAPPPPAAPQGPPAPVPQPPLQQAHQPIPAVRQTTPTQPQPQPQPAAVQRVVIEDVDEDLTDDPPPPAAVKPLPPVSAAPARNVLPSAAPPPPPPATPQILKTHLPPSLAENLQKMLAANPELRATLERMSEANQQLFVTQLMQKMLEK